MCKSAFNVTVWTRFGAVAAAKPEKHTLDCMLLLGSSQANEPHEVLSELEAEHSKHFLGAEEYMDASPCFSSVRQKDRVEFAACELWLSQDFRMICAINYW